VPIHQLVPQGRNPNWEFEHKLVNRVLVLRTRPVPVRACPHFFTSSVRCVAAAGGAAAETLPARACVKRGIAVGQYQKQPIGSRAM
jgi:hypothetical protein